MTAALEGGEWSAARPGRTLPPGKEPVPIVQEAGWPRGPVWTGGKSRPHWDSIPDHPARSQSLYRLSYRAHNSGTYLSKLPMFNTVRQVTIHITRTIPAVKLWYVYGCKHVSSNVDDLINNEQSRLKRHRWPAVNKANFQLQQKTAWHISFHTPRKLLHLPKSIFFLNIV